jgi:hypothetical protein
MMCPPLLFLGDNSTPKRARVRGPGQEAEGETDSERFYFGSDDDEPRPQTFAECLRQEEERKERKRKQRRVAPDDGWAPKLLLELSQHSSASNGESVGLIKRADAFRMQALKGRLRVNNREDSSVPTARGGGGGGRKKKKGSPCFKLEIAHRMEESYVMYFLLASVPEIEMSCDTVLQIRNPIQEVTTLRPLHLFPFRIEPYATKDVLIRKNVTADKGYPPTPGYVVRSIAYFHKNRWSVANFLADAKYHIHVGSKECKKVNKKPLDREALLDRVLQRYPTNYIIRVRERKTPPATSIVPAHLSSVSEVLSLAQETYRRAVQDKRILVKEVSIWFPAGIVCVVLSKAPGRVFRELIVTIDGKLHVLKDFCVAIRHLMRLLRNRYLLTGNNLFARKETYSHYSPLRNLRIFRQESDTSCVRWAPDNGSLRGARRTCFLCKNHPMGMHSFPRHEDMKRHQAEFKELLQGATYRKLAEPNPIQASTLAEMQREALARTSLKEKKPILANCITSSKARYPCGCESTLRTLLGRIASSSLCTPITLDEYSEQTGKHLKDALGTEKLWRAGDTFHAIRYIDAFKIAKTVVPSRIPKGVQKSSTALLNHMRRVVYHYPWPAQIQAHLQSQA